METRAVDADAVLRVYTACPNDVPTLILDVRNQKAFKASHLMQAFCIRCSSNGKALLDYSQHQYTHAKWSESCWWNKHVLLYGDAELKKDHPVMAYLIREGRCATLSWFRDGFEALERKYAFLTTASLKSNSVKKFPSQLVPGLLYLGDWADAEALARLEELKIRSVVSAHNHPENLKLPSHIKHLRIEVADLDIADISSWFDRTYLFIEDAAAKGHAVLVHCGAGVSRSATLCCAYLMRKNGWSAKTARAHCEQRRSLVCPNDGFWRTLCALEGSLGVSDRSDPTATSGFHGDDAPAVALAEGAGGAKVPVAMVEERELKRRRAAAEAEEADGGGSGGEADGRDEKRARGDGEEAGRSGSHAGASTSGKPAAAGGGGGVVMVLDVMKPEGRVGQLTVGPMRAHQKVGVGRAPGVSDLLLEHLSISRQHAVLTADGTGGVLLTDLGSGHGTKLDDTWIKAQAPKALKVGSKIQFGASTRTYAVHSIGRE